MAGRPHRGAHKPKERPDPTAFSGEVEASDDFLLDWIGQRTGPRELRQIVVLICGSVEGDPAESESDPEALEEKFAERSRLFGEVTARYGGSITRANIETQIAFWGWPGSSADDTRLAVAAALYHRASCETAASTLVSVIIDLYNCQGIVNVNVTITGTTGTTGITLT